MKKITLNLKQKDNIIEMINGHIAEIELKLHEVSNNIKQCETVKVNNTNEFIQNVHEYEHYLNESLFHNLLLSDLVFSRNKINSGYYFVSTFVVFSSNYKKMMQSVEFNISRLRNMIDSNIKGYITLTQSQVNQFEHQLELEFSKISLINSILYTFETLYLDVNKLIKEYK